MIRKIFLDGELGEKFTPVLEYEGDNIAGAFKCINANYPEFRKYLMDAHEADIGFSVEVEGWQLEDPRECLLNIREGDIIITPVPAGSKSGGGKILAAIALTTLLFIPGGAALVGLHGTMSSATIAQALSAAGGFYATAGTALGLLATNLAITGIQQLMAPDPSVDKEEPDSYLFNGAEQNIVEGDPVPVLYGRLRVPGRPISFDVTAGSSGRVPTRANYTLNANGDIDYEAVELAARASDAAEQSGTMQAEESVNRGTVLSQVDTQVPAEPTGAVRSQTITIVDLISEGPIYGLVNGTSSVYLDNKPVTNTVDSAIKLSETGATFTYNATTSVTVANLPSDITLGNLSGRYLIGREAYSSSVSSVSESTVGGIRKLTVNTASSFFQAAWVATDGSLINPLIRIKDTTSGQIFFEGIIESQSGTSAVCTSVQPFLVPVTGYTYQVLIDLPYEISSYSAPTITLSTAASFSGTLKADISSNIIDASTLALADEISQISKFPGFNITTRNGTKNQAPISDGDAGIASTSAFTTSPGTQLRGPGTDSTAVYGENTQSGGINTITYAGTDFYSGGSYDKWSQTDEIKIMFSYSSLYDQGPTTIHQGEAGYKIELRFSKVESATFGPWVNVGGVGSVFEHAATSTGPVAFQELIDLTRFKPFTNFEVRITRLTDDDVGYYPYNGNTGNWDYKKEYKGNSSVNISQITAIIKEPLSYPFTAYARTTFSSKAFTSTPTRTYDCRGLKVKVPNTYTTREKSTNGVADYSGTWSGTFKSEKEYTDNPAWVFYDIVTNKRYGVGQWVQETDIDKFALYRIARYCDELVPDGNGGEEPRFRANVYLTKATDAYKVLKDFATIFRGMLYWMDGELLSVADRAGDPIYNFSKANVIDGLFSYEGTGNRTRSNQVSVTWNNPASDYNQEVLIVEDRENIIKTGKIISENAVAFGATSEGQALRYGRWKLWTAVNQTEIVSFKTAINAAYLAPGDIIGVQDASRYPGGVQYSGRISSTGTLNTTTIPLDREVTLNSGSTYYLNVLIQQPGAFLNQASATISSTAYSRGDLISGVTTESAASNLTDDSGDEVQVTWSEYTRVETKTVSTGSGTVSSLTVGSAFSEIPKIQNIWTLTEANSSSILQDGSAKEYKILSITEDSKNEYSITAVEHYNQKFDSVDSDFTLSVSDQVYGRPDAGEVVPPPENVRVLIENKNEGTIDNDVTIMWEPPSNYDGVNGYYLTHTFPDLGSINLPAGQTSISGMDVPEGYWTVWIATINKNGSLSDRVAISFQIGTKYENTTTREFNIPIGATINTSASISTGGSWSLSSSTYTIVPAGGTREFSFTTAANDTYIQDCSTVPELYFDGMTESNKGFNSHYMYFDASNTSDPWRLVKYYNDTTLGVWYLYDTGTGNGVYTDYWSAGTGTIEVTAGSQTVVGTSTTFLTDFEIGSIIKIGTTIAAYVTQVIDNTNMLVDRVFTSGVSSGTAYYKPQFTPDVNRDCIVGAIRNTSSGSPVTSYPNTFVFIPMNLISEGVTGRDAISISLSNETDSLQCDTSGNILAGSFTGTGTTIKVFEGATQLAYDPTSPYANSSFNVTAAGTGITPNASPTADTAGTLTYGDASDAGSPDPADIYIDFTIDVVNSQGETFQFVKRQTFSKSVAGADGVTGGTLVTLYQTGNSAPSVPSGDLTYTYSTGVISGATLGSWSQNYQSVTSGAINLYAINATVIDSNPSSIPHVSTIATGDWSTPEIIAIYTENGEPGLRTIQGYLYYESTAGAPSAPSGNTYTFNSGLVSGTGINDNGTTNVWKNSPNVQDPTSTNTHYIVRYYGTEAAASATTIAVTYSANVSQHTNFDSVVTFSGGTGSFYEGATEITTIDGGNISTGTVTLDKLSSTYKYQAGENGVFHQFALDSTGETTFFDGLIDVTAWFFSQDTDLDLTVSPTLDNSVACVTTLSENLSGDAEARDAWSLVALNKWGAGYASFHDSDEVWGAQSDSWAGTSSYEYAFECGGHTFSYYGDAWLPSGWISSAVEDTLVETSPTDLAFSRNGDILYIVGTGNARVYQFPLTTPWDVTTRATSTGNLLVSSQTASPQAMFFSYDGIILYVASSTTIYRYNLTTAWNVTTATYSGDSQSFGTNITGIFFDRGGFRVYVSQSSGNDVTEYALATAWDITTAVSPALSTYNPTGMVSAQAVKFKPSGDVIYLMTTVSGNYSIYSYRLGRAWDLSSATTDSSSLQIVTATSTRGFYLDPGGNKLFNLEDGGTTAYVREYSSNLSLSPATLDVGDRPTIEHGYESSWNGYADKIGQPIQLWASDSNYANGYITEVQDDQFDIEITTRVGSSTLPEGAEIRHPSPRIFGIRPNGLITGLGNSWSRLNDVYHNGTTKYDYAYRGGLLYTRTSSSSIVLGIASKTITLNSALPSSVIGSRIVVKGKGVISPFYPNYYITGIITGVSGSSDVTFNLDAFNGNGATGTAVPVTSFTVEVYDTGIEILNTGATHIYDTTASTTYQTGALIVDGGVGVAGDVFTNGDISANGDIIAIASSDARLKDNLQVIPNALTKVDSISGYTFEWNEKSNKKGTSVGVIAQEIQEVLPEVVVEKGNGYLGVEYEKIIPLLIEAIKELKKEVEELKNDNS